MSASSSSGAGRGCQLREAREDRGRLAVGVGRAVAVEVGEVVQPDLDPRARDQPALLLDLRDVRRALGGRREPARRRELARELAVQERVDGPVVAKAHADAVLGPVEDRADDRLERVGDRRQRPELDEADLLVGHDEAAARQQGDRRLRRAGVDRRPALPGDEVVGRRDVDVEAAVLRGGVVDAEVRAVDLQRPSGRRAARRGRPWRGSGRRSCGRRCSTIDASPSRASERCVLDGPACASGAASSAAASALSRTAVVVTRVLMCPAPATSDGEALRRNVRPRAAMRHRQPSRSRGRAA